MNTFLPAHPLSNARRVRLFSYRRQKLVLLRYIKPHQMRIIPILSKILQTPPVGILEAKQDWPPRAGIYGFSARFRHGVVTVWRGVF